MEKRQFIPAPIRLTTPLNSLNYNMEHPFRGRCLIFDNEHFPARNLASRKGSEVDARALQRIFSRLDFQVQIYKDYTATGVKEVLKACSNYDHSDADCFVCCVMTHGEHGSLYGSDSRYPIDNLFHYFLGNNCPTLVGKPKIFFVQACQGDRLDSGVLVSGDRLDSTATYFKIPTYADFLIAYSTLPGFYSFRNQERGSWFVQSLVEVLEEYSGELDLLSMLTITSHNVAYRFSSNGMTPEFKDKKQVPCITSMLTRRVYFPPKQKPKQSFLL